jgi:hypothetical protein
VDVYRLPQAAFAYGLANGTIGVYDRLDRIWRVKSKHSVCALASFDLDGDGLPELVSGWNNGRVGEAGACVGSQLMQFMLHVNGCIGRAALLHRRTGK